MNGLSWEEWVKQIDAIADRAGLVKADDYEAGMERTWRPLFNKGLTPQQAWDAVPWRRDRPQH